MLEIQSLETMITAYSIEPSRVETIALQKNLQVKEEVVSLETLRILSQDQHSSMKPLVLIVSNLHGYQEVIQHSLRKVILIHLSDEAYDVKGVALYSHHNVKAIIRNYEVFSLPFLIKHSIKWIPLWLYWTIIYWRKESNYKDNIKHSRHMMLSRRYLLRQIRFAWYLKRVNKKIVNFPLNETNFFYQGINNEMAEKKYPISFAGGAHSSERVVAVKTAQNLGVAFSHSGEWKIGKTPLTSKDYVQLLQESWFTLCPNGHVNQDCFRFYEAISAGSLPIVPFATPYQPFSYYGAIYDLDPRLKVRNFHQSSIEQVLNSIDKNEIPLIIEKLKNSVAYQNQQAFDALLKLTQLKVSL